LELREVGNKKRIDDDNPVALCGKIGEEGKVIAGGRFETEKQGMVPFEMSDQLLETLLIHTGGKREDLLSALVNAARIKRVF
jgi:hypothetical protein